MAAAVRFTRLPDPGAGLRAYAVRQGDTELGTVTNRRGGWWRAITAAGDYAGSWHSTRAAAAAALTDRQETAT